MLFSEPKSYCPPICPEHMFSSLAGRLKRLEEAQKPTGKQSMQVSPVQRKECLVRLMQVSEV